MFTSWPLSALVAGVKIGSGSRSLSIRPGGSAMPQTVPGCGIPSSPIPTRYPRTTHSIGTTWVLRTNMRAAGQRFAVGPGRQVHVVDVGGQQMVRLAKPLEPESAGLGQYPPFVGNARGKDPIECADAIGGDQEQFVAKVENIAHLATAHGQAGERRFEDHGPGHRLSRQ